MRTLIFLFALAGATPPASGTPVVKTLEKAADTNIELTIIGTSDLHGRIAQLPAFGGYLAAIRSARPGRVLTVDAGDVWQGTLESDSNEGEVAVRAYDLLGYNAVAIGNHEFDFGPVGPRSTALAGQDSRGALKARVLEAQKTFPFLAANLTENGKALAWPNVKAHTIVSLAGVQVGIIGVTTMDTPTTTIAANFAGLAVTPLAETVQREAKAVRSEGAQVVLLVAHAGGRCTKLADESDTSSCEMGSEIFKLAQALLPGTVDAIVAGHMHSGVAQDINGIPITESFAQGQSFGRIDLSFDPHTAKVTAHKIFAPQKIESKGVYEGQPLVANAAVQAAIGPALAAAEVKRQALIGSELAEMFERSYGAESTLGNFLTSVMLASDKRAKIAITNGGGIRADLPAGPLRYGAVYNALPFDNRVVLVTMSGAAVRELYAHNLVSKGGMFSIAGAAVKAECKEQKLVVSLTWPNGKSIADNDQLTVATNDFLATGGDGFSGSHMLTPIDEAPVLRDTLVDYFHSHPGPLHARDWFHPDAPRMPTTARPWSCSRAP